MLFLLFRKHNFAEWERSSGVCHQNINPSVSYKVAPPWIGLPSYCYLFLLLTVLQPDCSPEKVIKWNISKCVLLPTRCDANKFSENNDRASLTCMKSGEEDPEFALPAALVCPEPHYTHRGHQHHIIGHRGAELVLEVLDRTASIIDRNKVSLALIRVVHLVLKKAHVDLLKSRVRFRPTVNWSWLMLHV